MAHLSTAVCRRLACARRDKGLTQSALARAVGCQQSAISMLESGQPEKLARETVERLAALLEVTLEPPAPEPGAAGGGGERAREGRGFCPDAACPTNVPYTVGGVLLFWPRLQALAPGGRCAACGELLESGCPRCGAAVAAEGACCTACGAARVTNTLPEGMGTEAWAEARRRELAAWRGLLA